MKTKLIAAAALTLAVAAPTASAQKPTPHELSIAASSPRIVFGEKVALTGTLTGADNVGETVTLEEDPFPFGDFKKSVSTLTTAGGAYRFERTPSLNIRYRAEAKSKPPATSPVTTVLVAPAVTFKVSDRTPKAGQRVRFSGTLAPAHDGLKVSIQRRTSKGGYKTIARATLTDAGDALSNWKRTLRINSSGTFRVILPKHDDHATGKSRRIKLAVGS